MNESFVWAKKSDERIENSFERDSSFGHNWKSAGKNSWILMVWRKRFANGLNGVW
jgi:hypothetical protein